MIFILAHAEARRRALEAIRSAPDGYAVRVEAPKKSREQEDRYHAMIGDIAKQHRLYGRLWDSEDMKRLLIDQFWRDTKDDPELKGAWDRSRPRVAPSIDGTGVVQLGAQSRRFPKKLASAFIDWLFAFGAENTIVWPCSYGYISCAEEAY